MSGGEPQMTYWLATLAVFVLSYLTGFSIGFFLLPVALAMLILGPFRHWPSIYWPPMAALLAFVAAYLAVAPLYCTATTSVVGNSTTSTSSCASLVGIITYPETNPSVVPAVTTGASFAAVTAVIVATTIWWRGRLAHRSSS
jgi:hypothetical protein